MYHICIIFFAYIENVSPLDPQNDKQNSNRWCHQVCICLYLRWKVVEAKHKSPVEISFSGQRAEVDVSLLFVSVQPLYPSAHREQNQDQDVNKPISFLVGFNHIFP